MISCFVRHTRFEAKLLDEDQLLDSLQRDAVRRLLNQGRWDEARYLIILYGSSRIQPFALHARSFESFRGFKRDVLQDFAKEFALKFEFLKGAIRLLEERFEKGFGYVKTFKGSENATYYAITPNGAATAESALTQAIKIVQQVETITFPNFLLEKFKHDLKRVTSEKSLFDPEAIRKLFLEYQNEEAVAHSSDATPISKPRKVKLRANAISIGRSVDNALSFPNDRYMSRKNTLVEFVDGIHIIRDLGSRNGTWRIDSSGKRTRVEKEKLMADAIYEVGTTRLTFSK